MRLTPQDLAMFAQVNANFPKFVDYLKVERREALKIVTQHRDPVTINRNQGGYTTLDKLIENLETASKILHAQKS